MLTSLKKHLTIWLLLTTLIHAAPLVTIENCTLIDTDWADGDSFRVQIPDLPAQANSPGHKARQITIRIYGADCLETHVRTDSDHRRLRAQRRYFGITNFKNNPQKSIELAKNLGEQATIETKKILSKPFTIHTAFADARGSARYKRYYGFITTADGKDLAQQLVEKGLARAYGVYRETHNNLSSNEYRARLKDFEFQAAKTEQGIWKYTNWKTLPNERQAERDEEKKLQSNIDNQKLRILSHPINPNKASRDELMLLPGIGESKANDIIQNRPYKNSAELQQKIKGIGPNTLKKLLPLLTFPETTT